MFCGEREGGKGKPRFWVADVGKFFIYCNRRDFRRNIFASAAACCWLPSPPHLCTTTMMIHKFLSDCQQIQKLLLLKVVKYFDVAGVEGKMRFPCKNQMNSLSSPQTKKNGTAASIVRKEWTRDEIAFSDIIHKNFIRLVGSPSPTSQHLVSLPAAYKLQHHRPLEGKSEGKAVHCWMIMATKYFALEHFFDSIVTSPLRSFPSRADRGCMQAFKRVWKYSQVDMTRHDFSFRWNHELLFTCATLLGGRIWDYCSWQIIGVDGFNSEDFYYHNCKFKQSSTRSPSPLLW